LLAAGADPNGLDEVSLTETSFAVTFHLCFSYMYVSQVFLIVLPIATLGPVQDCSLETHGFSALAAW
jgi:hypothetical protein